MSITNRSISLQSFLSPWRLPSVNCGVLRGSLSVPGMVRRAALPPSSIKIGLEKRRQAVIRTKPGTGPPEPRFIESCRPDCVCTFIKNRSVLRFFIFIVKGLQVLT